MQTLVQRKLLAINLKNKHELSIEIVIGFPYWTEENVEAKCSVKIVGLFETIPDVCGVDFMQAIQLAIEVSEAILLNTKSEYLITWPDKENYF